MPISLYSISSSLPSSPEFSVIMLAHPAHWLALVFLMLAPILHIITLAPPCPWLTISIMLAPLCSRLALSSTPLLVSFHIMLAHPTCPLALAIHNTPLLVDSNIITMLTPHCPWLLVMLAHPTHTQ